MAQKGVRIDEMKKDYPNLTEADIRLVKSSGHKASARPPDQTASLSASAVLLNLLLDENLSPSLIARLAANGISAQHAAYVGLSGKSDSQVWGYAFGHEQVVVTINAKDFLNLGASTELHPGLIILRQSGNPLEKRR